MTLIDLKSTAEFHRHLVLSGSDVLPRHTSPSAKRDAGRLSLRRAASEQRLNTGFKKNKNNQEQTSRAAKHQALAFSVEAEEQRRRKRLPNQRLLTQNVVWFDYLSKYNPLILFSGDGTLPESVSLKGDCVFRSFCGLT